MTLTFLVTAFCSCVLCVGPRWVGARTSTGTVPAAGRTLACARGLEGAVLEVDGRALVCESTGSKVRGLHLDVFVRTHQEGVRRGRRRVPARVLHLPPGVDLVDGQVVRVRPWR